MKFISKITDALKLAEAHTVVIVKEAVRLPGIVLDAGVHHLDYDVRLLLKKSKDVRAASLCEIHTLAGDTVEVLAKLYDSAKEDADYLSHCMSGAQHAVQVAKDEVMTLTAALEHAVARGAEAVEAEAIHAGAIVIQQAIHAVENAKGRLSAAESYADATFKALGNAEARLEIAAARVGAPDATAVLAAAEAKRAAEALAVAEAAALAAARAAELAAAKKAADEALAAAHAADAKVVANLVDPVVITDEVPVAPVVADVAPVSTPDAGSVDAGVDPMHQA